MINPAINLSHRRITRSLLLFGFLGSVLGSAISFVLHLAALMGVDPGSHIASFGLFQLLVFLLLVPIIIEVFRKRNPAETLRCSRPGRILQVCLLAYYAANFYIFLFWSGENLDGSVTWRMFSSGWMLLFTMAAVFYHVRWSEVRPRRISGSLLASD